jgi:sigma-B regulation protein RsbU (phosphoserine phosphatase)
VYVRVRREADHALLEVRNHNEDGPIPPSLLPHIFDPFRRGSRQHGARTGGLGLGLYITEQIVKRHGGTIDVTSTQKETTFHVRLPIAADRKSP